MNNVGQWDEKDELCCGCSACMNVCPHKAITMEPDVLGFKYPIISRRKCVDCGLCVKICPVISSACDVECVEKHEYMKHKSYACIALDDSIREESSSGGVFGVIAEEVISRGGVVFGAEFAENFSVRHGWEENISALGKLRRSKYVQSSIGTVYSECKQFLDRGRLVLFSGTPCQISGLKAYLRKDYSNLITVEVICHGVPSSELWQRYIAFREKKSASKTIKTTFRQKDDGWMLSSLSFIFTDGSEYKQVNAKDMYMQLFLRDNALRESCYRCAFRGDRHNADLTLGDFWGVDKICPELYDDKGTSLVVIQTEKGQRMLDSCKKLKRQETDFSLALKFNPSYYRSMKRNKMRDLFFKEFEKHDIVYLYKKFGRAPFRIRFANCVVVIAKAVLGEDCLTRLKQKFR